MTREDIIRMAREAGYQHPDAVGTCEDFAYFDLERFAALVAAAEREACARACETAAELIWEYHPEQVKTVGESVCTNLAASIRARGD